MSAQHAGQNLPVIRQAENLDDNRVVLYKRSKQLGSGYYLVEISTNNTHLFIAAFEIVRCRQKSEMVASELDAS